MCQPESELFVKIGPEQESHQAGQIDADGEAEGKGEDLQIEGGGRLQAWIDPLGEDPIEDPAGIEVGDEFSQGTADEGPQDNDHQESGRPSRLLGQGAPLPLVGRTLAWNLRVKALFMLS